MPVEAAALLRGAGHDVATVLDQGMKGSLDREVADASKAEGLVLVTLDVDFGNIQVYPPAQFAGLVVLRLGRQDKAHVLEVTASLVPHLSSPDLRDWLWVVEETRIRMRS